MADTDRLQVAQRGNYADNHFLELLLAPKGASGFSFTEHVFEVGPIVHMLAYHGDSISVVHCLIEVISIELEDIRMALHFEQLHGFFLFLQKYQVIIDIRTNSNISTHLVFV